MVNGLHRFADPGLAGCSVVIPAITVGMQTKFKRYFI
jgi:hypothetical protein